MNSGFDVNSFCDNIDDGYGVFDDVVDSLAFAADGISTAAPEEAVIRPTQPVVPSTPTRPSKRRGRKPGQKPTCGSCGTVGHTKRTCGL